MSVELANFYWHLGPFRPKKNLILKKLNIQEYRIDSLFIFLLPKPKASVININVNLFPLKKEKYAGENA